MAKFFFVPALLSIWATCLLVPQIYCLADFSVVQKNNQNLNSRDSLTKSPKQDYVAFDMTSTLQGLSKQDFWVLNHPFDSVKVDSLPMDEYPLEKVKYPRSAALKEIEGTVVLRVLIDTDGNVIKIIVVKSDSDMLTESAVLPVKKAKFQPAILEGKPTYYWFSCPITFRLVR